MGEVTQYARQAYLGTGPKGLLRATKGSKLPHPYRGITQVAYPLFFGTVLAISVPSLCLATPQSTKLYRIFSVFLLGHIVRHIDCHLPKVGVHRSR